MTREHVIPSFVYAFQKELGASMIGWNEVVGKMIPSQGTVKDVCASCNNNALSELDSYGKALLTQSGLLVHNFTALRVTLAYDFDLLARWLLKVSFNSARTDGAHSHLFDGLEPYILGAAGRPSRSRFAMCCYLAGPLYLDEAQRRSEQYTNLTSGSDRFNPFLVRICYGVLPGGPSYILRVNVFGPMVFYLLLFPEGLLPGHAGSAVRRLLKLCPGAAELIPTRRVLELRAGAHNFLQLYAAQIRRAHQAGGGDIP